jgi:hypothetical protein
LAAGLAAAVAACDSTATVPVAPSSPTPTLVTESFAGDVQPGGVVVHHFTAVEAGVVTATLGSLSPLSTAYMGMSIGVWDGTSCSSVAQNDSVKVGSSVIGTATINNVSLCLRVYDVGNVPPDATYSYTVTVTHF